MIASVDYPLVVSPRIDANAESFDVLLGGLHTAPSIVTHEGWQAGIQLAIRPLACRVLFGMPAGELAHADIAGSSVLGSVANDLHAHINELSDWPARFAALDAALLALLDTERSVDTKVGIAYRTLVSTSPMPVSTLADELGWSERHLANRVRAETGLTPRPLRRVARFDRARRALAGERVRLADVAATYHYCDQAHLSRDFAAFAGLPPLQWLAAEFGNVQDAATILEHSAWHD